MAKVGEGDDRWIVAERQDGTNVNSWHWQEKDAFGWSRERFADLIGAIEFEDGGVKCRCVGVTALTGEAYVNRRKGKIICGYELDLKIGYEGTISENDKVVKGNVHFPYIADENAGEEHEARVLAGGEGPDDRRVKEIMRLVALPKMHEGVAKFEKELAAGGPGGEGADHDEAKNASSGSKPATREDFRDKKPGDVQSNAEKEKETRTDKTAPLSQKAHTIRLTERFYCRPKDVCDALMDGNRVMHFSRSPAQVKPEPGPFSMFDGNIHGETLEYVPGEKIVQRWRFRNWKEGHFSKVTITFREPEPGNCFVDLVQTDVPETDAFDNETVMDTTEVGWKQQIFERIRQVFGYGA